ncbi:MAG: hypothetical protein CMO46_01245 [Verrucomicrobiales bacterium]|nr:hypothetical protein [Verrucomicrobiales bacterium]
MDFFVRQDIARKNSKILIFYYSVAVLGISFLIGLTVLFIRSWLLESEGIRYLEESINFFDLKVFLLSAGPVLVLILLASFFKSLALSKGGGAMVAKSLGGREVDRSTNNHNERVLVNVIEEMSIASGVPVPSIFILDQEDDINAFAAGYTPSDAAIGVTSGCLNMLNRDELQGVIAHEFSHILNGDMRLNIRMISILFGILVLTLIGYFTIRFLPWGSSRRSSSNSKEGNGGGLAIILIIALAMMIFGFIGQIMAKLIKAAVSRQREFLADASAVQFTRNPAGISGALKKIGGGAGSIISHHRAEEASHMFFGSCFKKKFINIFATHPPLEDRIRAIDGTFDGFDFIDNQDHTHSQSEQTESGISSFSGGDSNLINDESQQHRLNSLEQLGQINEEQLYVARGILSTINDKIIDAVRDKSGAKVVAGFLLLSSDELIKKKQIVIINDFVGPSFDDLEFHINEISDSPSATKMALMDLCLPSLRNCSENEYDQFCNYVDALIFADDQVDLFEYMVQRIIRRHLDKYFGRVKKMSAFRYVSLSNVNNECSLILSAMAGVGSAIKSESQEAFSNGAFILESEGSGNLKMLEQDQFGLHEIDQALDTLEKCSGILKKKILVACGTAALSDNHINCLEIELLRAIADSIGTPIPPFVFRETDNGH